MAEPKLGRLADVLAAAERVAEAATRSPEIEDLIMVPIEAASDPRAFGAETPEERDRLARAALRRARNRRVNARGMARAMTSRAIGSRRPSCEVRRPRESRPRVRRAGRSIRASRAGPSDPDEPEPGDEAGRLDKPTVAS